MICEGCLRDVSVVDIYYCKYCDDYICKHCIYMILNKADGMCPQGRDVMRRIVFSASGKTLIALEVQGEA